MSFDEVTNMPRKRDPFKNRARSALRNAVKSGFIVKPNNCQHCGIAASPVLRGTII